MALVIGHRGAPRQAKENTLASFAKAKSLGCDMVEFDVRETADGDLVVVHDSKISGHRVGKLTVPQVKHLDADIPTLQEALAFLKGQMKINVEAKDKGTGLKVAGQILKFFNRQDVIITSSFAEDLKKIKSAFPDVLTGWIVGNRRWQSVVNLLLLAAGQMPKDVDLLVINWILYLLGFSYLAKGKKILVFTMDRVKIFRRLISHNEIFGIITNLSGTIWHE